MEREKIMLYIQIKYDAMNYINWIIVLGMMIQQLDKLTLRWFNSQIQSFEFCNL